MEQEADDGRSDAQGDDERGEALEAVHLLQQEADEDEQEPVTGVAHAEGEEQQEEDGDEGRGVETVVGRAAVHVGQDLEHLHELVVAEADGRVVVHLRVVLEVEHAGFLYSLGDSFFVLRGRVAHERDDGVLRGGHGGLLGQVEVWRFFAVRRIAFSWSISAWTSAISCWMAS